ncbi:MAG: DtxR family transcriptional regulator [Homoserinimonas sp.]|nr:DtxR family transcriptional regulator [Homoserinimonas sp.]
MSGRHPGSAVTGRVVEDYVKTIYTHTEWQEEPIGPSALAERLGLAASSVTEMVNKLAAQGLVSHVRYGTITLTPAGRTLALRMVRRHRLIETWLVESFGYSWDEVHDEAEVLEHTLSDRLLEAIDEQLGHPVHDPHGDAIPSADGVVMRPAAVMLRDAAEGFVGTVVRISDHSSTLLRYFASERIVLDARVQVISSRPLMLRVGDIDIQLGEEAAASIWLSLG